jgi:hypothetical protein
VAVNPEQAARIILEATVREQQGEPHLDARGLGLLAARVGAKLAEEKFGAVTLLYRRAAEQARRGLKRARHGGQEVRECGAAIVAGSPPRPPPNSPINNKQKQTLVFFKVRTAAEAAAAAAAKEARRRADASVRARGPRRHISFAAPRRRQGKAARRVAAARKQSASFIRRLCPPPPPVARHAAGSAAAAGEADDLELSIAASAAVLARSYAASERTDEAAIVAAAEDRVFAVMKGLQLQLDEACRAEVLSYALVYGLSEALGCAFYTCRLAGRPVRAEDRVNERMDQALLHANTVGGNAALCREELSAVRAAVGRWLNKNKVDKNPVPAPAELLEASG